MCCKHSGLLRGMFREASDLLKADPLATEPTDRNRGRVPASDAKVSSSMVSFGTAVEIAAVVSCVTIASDATVEVAMVTPGRESRSRSRASARSSALSLSHLSTG
jgi:hypothetical protein